MLRSSLRKKDAQSLRQYLMDLMEASGEESIKERKADAEQMQYDVEASLGDMIVHGLFSINLFSLLVLLGCAVGMAEVVSDTLGQGFAGKSIMGILARHSGDGHRIYVSIVGYYQRICQIL